jgi:hypothetical protein
LDDFVVVLECTISFGFVVVEVVIEGLSNKVLDDIVRSCSVIHSDFSEGGLSPDSEDGAGLLR